MSFARLTPAGRGRLNTWINDVLLDKSEVQAWMILLEQNLVEALLDADVPAVCISKSETLRGTQQEFRLRIGEYAVEIDDEDDSDDGISLEPLRWGDLNNEDKVAYAASAVILTDMCGRFVVSGNRYKFLMDAVKASPLPVRIQNVLGAGVSRSWRKFGKTAQQYQAPLMALHAFCEAHVDDFEVAWSNCKSLLSSCLDDFKLLITFEKPYMVVSHPKFPVTEEAEAAYRKAKRDIGLAESQAFRSALDDKDPAKNGRPDEIFILPRKEVEHSFTWWSLQLGFMVGSEFRDQTDYTRAIDEIADRCLCLMPQAIQQAKKSRLNVSDTDRYGTVENESLPRYVRWLIKRGQKERAALFCNAAIAHRISPTSPGAFERGLATAMKRPAKK